MPNAFTLMTTCPALGSGSGISLMTRLSRPPNFSRTIARMGPLLGRLTISAKCRASLGARQEMADCRSDLVTVRLEGEVAGPGRDPLWGLSEPAVERRPPWQPIRGNI